MGLFSPTCLLWARETKALIDEMKDIPPEEPVPAMSPARLLAKSLTDGETRGEWARCDSDRDAAIIGYVSTTRFVNTSRNLTISRTYSGGGYGCGSQTYISTPFRLNKAEENIVLQATHAFERHLSEEREKEALARLIAPASGMSASGQDPQGLEAKPAGPTAEGGDAQ